METNQNNLIDAEDDGKNWSEEQTIDSTGDNGITDDLKTGSLVEQQEEGEMDFKPFKGEMTLNEPLKTTIVSY